MSDPYSRLMGIISAEAEAATDAERACIALFKPQAGREARKHPDFIVLRDIQKRDE